MASDATARARGREIARALPLRRPRPPRRRRRAARATSGCPALVVWGRDDPYLPPRVRPCLRRRGCRAPSCSSSTGAGHWPWLDRPEAVDRVVRLPQPPMTVGNGPLQSARDARVVGVSQGQRAAARRASSTPGCSSCSSSSPTTATRWSAGSPTRARIAAFANAQHVIDLEQLARHVLRARLPAGAARARAVADRLRELHVPELALRDHHRLPGLALPASATSTSTSSATCSWSRWGSPWSATRSSRPRRRGCSPGSASPTRSRPSPGSPRTRRPRACWSTSTRPCPSMHIAFSLMIAVPAAALLPARALTRRCGRSTR